VTGGGFIILEGNKVIDGRFESYEGDVKTNNKAEVTALRDALSYFQTKYQVSRGEKLNVFGDS